MVSRVSWPRFFTHQAVYLVACVAGTCQNIGILEPVGGILSFYPAVSMISYPYILYPTDQGTPGFWALVGIDIHVCQALGTPNDPLTKILGSTTE